MGVKRCSGSHEIVADERPATDQCPPEREDNEGHRHHRWQPSITQEPSHRPWTLPSRALHGRSPPHAV